MEINKIKTFYRRSLPHIQPIGACFFVTFRLHGSIPKDRLYRLRKKFESETICIQNLNSEQAKRYLNELRTNFFHEYEKLLHGIKSGPHYLEIPDIASIVASEIERYDGDLYDLICYCIMSNHVHILIDTSIQLEEDLRWTDLEQLKFEPLHRIMKRIKGTSARFANILMNRSGTFWQKESYDHYIRDEREFNNVSAYILNNPVKAGIVKSWEDYPYTFVKYPE